jgi:uncharacterized membrane protein
MKSGLLGLALAASALFAQDTHCPAYPAAVRQAAEERLDRDRDFFQYQLTEADPDKLVSIPASNNFIDDLVFAKLRRDGVDAAELTTDSEFVRRVYLDLTGRIPTLAQAQDFLGGTSSDRRSRLVERLLESEAYTDQFAHWFIQRFRITTSAGNWISTQERNNFYDFVRAFVANDSPYDTFVRSLLTATGDGIPWPVLQHRIADSGSVGRFHRWCDNAVPRLQDRMHFLSRRPPSFGKHQSLSRTASAK